ncbi:3-isopropylmalate dehydratase large subunit [Pantoea sp. JGM49]|uniref:3-isopropylmalate dehydratase large subunit n=1 Tax=unclassified Pantoea TaxID=2630326 RepID=UPI000BDB8F5E|nr:MULTISPECIES: 3-isopropylmalate dehydratase large subunit [unclassified Pantoea]MBS0881929.1 3-isopropylmalate dehydratase large subunit [Pantoea sp. JGM49]MXP54377.1 3-isopropylmalate dehydratase large subunit [Pantoea sp. Seng]SNY74514.1 3-isopropylmalate dehydratase, large subunit [Pantoea sp. GL120224-02]
MANKTLYEKLIDQHVVRQLDDEGHVLLYIDRSILNEYTSPQAFSGLREHHRPVRRPATILLNVDHVNPTRPERDDAMTDAGGQLQVDYFRQNAAHFGIELFDVMDPRQGIEHVVAHEQGLVMPGMVIAAGDSHTTTYGAFGALGFGIGTSEIEHLLATQTLIYRTLKTMRVTVTGELPYGCSAKDIILALIEDIGASGATGYAIEFDGPAIDALSMEGRMTLCNMAVEAGARGAIIAPDEKVFAYIQGKPQMPTGALWEQAKAEWMTLRSDDGAKFDRAIELDCSDLEPKVTWGISPDQTCAIGGCVPDPQYEPDLIKQQAIQAALKYMGLEPGMRLSDIAITHAFIGSCTNGRIEDLRAAAAVIGERKIARHVRGIIVPGSTQVRQQAEAEGLADIFINAGFEWRQSGCSMCLAMNEDVLEPGDRCASGTNRNFAGRQGAGARTHLMSPAMVAAAAVAGHLVDVRNFTTVEV